MEALANAVVRALYTQLVDPTTGQPGCALVRFYKTHHYDRLGPDLQAIAGSHAGLSSISGIKCLTLLATAGDRPEWNDRHSSVNHQVIPLPSEEIVTQSPMIAHLFKQFGLKPHSLLHGDPQTLLGLEHRTYDIFYVPDAVGSPYIPAQEELVIPYGIKSVVGFGGVLPYGDLFATILFAKVPIPPRTAKRFETLALSLKMALVPYVGKRVFA